MKTQLKVKFVEMATSGTAVRTLRLLVVFAVLITSFLLPEVAAAGPIPGPTGD